MAVIGAGSVRHAEAALQRGGPGRAETLARTAGGGESVKPVIGAGYHMDFGRHAGGDHLARTRHPPDRNGLCRLLSRLHGARRSAGAERNPRYFNLSITGCTINSATNNGGGVITWFAIGY